MDWHKPLKQLNGDAEVLREITESYLAEIRENLTGLSQAISEGNVVETRRLAHTIKGAMRFFGAQSAADACFELEDLANSGDLSSAQGVFEVSRSEVEQVIPLLQRFLNDEEM